MGRFFMQLAGKLARERTRRRQAEADTDDARGQVEALTGKAKEARKNEERVQDALQQAQKRELLLENKLARERTRRRQAEADAGDARGQVKELTEALEGERRARQIVKGGDPPCWYKRVATRKGGDREKSLYVIDIAIHDRYIILGRRSPPQGGPDRGERGDYRAEYDKLGLGKLPYDQRLGDTEVQNTLKPIWDAGKNEQVRSYSCKFFAQVWDHTGDASKRRWKQAHKLIQQYFYTREVPPDEEWPHL